MKTRQCDADVIIVGGGHAGLTLCALLATHDIKTICIDRDDPKDALKTTFDGRTTAISYGSRRVIDAGGAWDAVIADACPIRDIQILDSGSPVLLDFLVDDVAGNETDVAFGWIVENRLLRRALFDRLATLKKATHIAPATVADFSRDDDAVTVHLADGRSFRAPLVIGADGRGSFTREWMGINTRHWSYKQRAIICTVIHDNPHNNIAIEHFRREGPFAVLPMMDDDAGRHRSSVVWSEHGAGHHSALDFDDTTFNAALSARFPDWYGTVRVNGPRAGYPLGLVHAHDYIAPRMALVADAAHGIHPIAGQGLNLGLRDIALLAELLVDAARRGDDPGNAALLQTYQEQRRIDNMAMAAATDTLNRLFSNSITPVRIARKIGLRAVQRFAPARKFFMRQAMGAAGALPKIIRGEKL
jgi:2-octaprenyl-6-methoxyphenol hydroxylase